MHAGGAKYGVGVKYAERFCDWLTAEGYTHCFFVAGGNIMHLLDAARTRFTCVPFVHEVAAGIAAEYFNEFADEGEGRAFALVTAGPGLTNVVTAMAGAFLESRELLVVGGQVKSVDLATGGLRQRGIQEIDGLSIAKPICVSTLAVNQPLPRDVVMSAVRRASQPRKGPVFIEFCLDAQGAPVQDEIREETFSIPKPQVSPSISSDAREAARIFEKSSRPLVLIGGGLSRSDAHRYLPGLAELGIPLATTWNGADRVGSEHPLYFGRPNTWGMRWSNALIQQSDALLALGTRLGMQQTGFHWQAFAPRATIVHVDIDPIELAKGHPRTHLSVAADAGQFLERFIEHFRSATVPTEIHEQWKRWVKFGHEVRQLLPLADPANEHAENFVDPFDFMVELSAHLRPNDFIVPCSSGGAFTVAMQALNNKFGQRIATDKGLASMGYGLSGAIGAALTQPGRRTILFEGDGGFAQNLQELGTVIANQLPLKIFIFCNEGYASIRMTQRNYFGGSYIGCDTATGLGLPNWVDLFGAYGIRTITVNPQSVFGPSLLTALESLQPVAFLVPIDPEQTYYPKITSRVTDTGAMESNPLHLMTPDLEEAVALRVFQFGDDLGERK